MNKLLLHEEFNIADIVKAPECDYLMSRDSFL